MSEKNPKKKWRNETRNMEIMEQKGEKIPMNIKNQDMKTTQNNEKRNLEIWKSWRKKGKRKIPTKIPSKNMEKIQKSRNWT